MRIQTALFTGTLLIPLALGRPEPAAAQTCTTTQGDSVINGLLTSLTPVLNAAWPSVAVSTGIDPMTDIVSDAQVSLSCSDGGDEICGVQGSECKSEYAEVTVSQINGLSYMQFKNLSVTSLTAQPGTVSCPYKSSANGGTYACSYSGSGTGSAYLVSNGQITADISEIKVKAQCEVPLIGTKFTETLFSGSAKCTGTDPTGSATFKFCGGSCQSGIGAVLSYGAMSKLNLKLGQLSCNVSPSYNPLSWVADSLAPELKSTIIEQITDPLEDALNDLIADSLPYPAQCGG